MQVDGTDPSQILCLIDIDNQIFQHISTQFLMTRWTNLIPATKNYAKSTPWLNQYKDLPVYDARDNPPLYYKERENGARVYLIRDWDSEDMMRPNLSTLMWRVISLRKRRQYSLQSLRIRTMNGNTKQQGKRKGENNPTYPHTPFHLVFIRPLFIIYLYHF